MKNLLTNLKLIKYGYQLKSNIIMSCIFIFIGLLYVLLNEHSNLFLAVFYIIAAQVLFFQGYNAIFAANIGMTASKRYSLEVHCQNFIFSIIGIFSYLIITLIILIKRYFYICPASDYRQLTWIGLTISLVLFYATCAYKENVLCSIPIFLILYMLLFVFSNKLTHLMPFNFPLCFFVGLLCTILGIIISCLLRKFLYRKSFAKWAFGVYFEKDQKNC